MIETRESESGLKFSVRVIPRSSRSEIVGDYNGALKVKLTSPPVDGAANKELINLLSKVFGIAKARVRITSGESSKTKTVQINGVSVSDFHRNLDF